MKHLRVLLLLPSLSGGGAERTAVTLLNGVDRSKFDIRLGLLKAEGPYLQDIQISDVELPTVKNPKGWLHASPGDSLDDPTIGRMLSRLVRVPLSILQLRELIRRVNPDVIISFMTAFNIMTGLALKISGTSHVRWIAREGNNVKTVFRHTFSNRLLQILVSKISRWSHLSADCTLAISHGLGDSLVQHLRIPPEDIRVIYNPTNVQWIRQRSKETQGDCTYGRFIVAVGRLEEQKGFEVLIRAYARCAEQQDIKLVILGEGSQRKKLEALATELGVRDRVILPGFVKNPWAYIASAAMFVLPSLWEGFGHVVIEAMACQTPVIVTDCDFGPKEIVQHGENGLVVPAGDVEALKKAIISLLEDSNKAKQIVERGNQRVQDFDVPVVIRRYEALFREIGAGENTRADLCLSQRFTEHPLI